MSRKVKLFEPNQDPFERSPGKATFVKCFFYANNVLHRADVDHDLVFIRRGKDAALNEQHDDGQNPKKLFAPSPQRINQQRTDDEELEIHSKVPGNIVTLKGSFGISS